MQSKVIRADYRSPNYAYREVTHLFTNNDSVTEFNLAACKNTPIRILSDDHLNGTNTEEMERMHMRKLSELKARDAQGLETGCNVL